MKSSVAAPSAAVLSGLVLLAFAAAPAASAYAEKQDHAQAPAHAEADLIEEIGASEGEAPPNPLKFDPDLAVFTGIVFLLLLGVLYKFAWGPISAALDQREKNIADQIAAAESANDEAKRMLAEYEARLAKAAEEVRRILDEARRDAEHTQQEILAKARADAGTEIDRARREIGTAKDQAIKELAETSANLAVDLAGRIVRANLSVQDHARLIEEAMASFPKGDHRGN
jgi:F-type H+-transporting ATPase subunit b